MQRETLATALLALLVVVALGVAAATLDSAVTADGGGIGGAGGDGPIGASDDTAVSAPGEAAAQESRLSLSGVCYPALREPPAVAILVGIIMLVGGLAYRDTGAWLAALVVAGAVGLPVVGVWYLLSTCVDSAFETRIAIGTGGDGDGRLALAGERGGIGGDGAAVSTPEALFLLVVAVAVIGSLLVLLATRGDDDASATDAGDSGMDASDEPDLQELARTAGEAADRIETAEANNEVYRAWREMTAVLDVERPASSTPGEFAAAAIDAGVDPEPVDRLTAVFEEVRYGDSEPTDERERAAVEALRRIEAAHGGDA